MPLETAAGRFFPGGMLRLPSGKVISILRIGLFSEHAFPELCHEAIQKLHVSETANCDDACENQIELVVANSLTVALANRAAELRAAGAAALLGDITRNGGGSDWVEAASRTLSSVPLRDSRLGFVKHPHWTENLRAELADLESDLKTHPEAQVVLNDAVEKIKAAIEVTKEHCDTTAVWQTGKLSCSMLVKDKLFVSGVLDYLKSGSFGGFESKTTLFHPLRYAYTEDTKRLPLYVLVDRDTWSSAEYFAAILQDNHAATIVGENPGGAGCGYTNGGIPVTLKNSGASVKMPDCVRFRSDGSNEVNGITPDLIVPWPREASDYQRAMRLIPVLDKAITAANSR
jgi:hypothetical protein